MNKLNSIVHPATATSVLDCRPTAERTWRTTGCYSLAITVTAGKRESLQSKRPGAHTHLGTRGLDSRQAQSILCAGRR